MTRGWNVWWLVALFALGASSANGAPGPVARVVSDPGATQAEVSLEVPPPSLASVGASNYSIDIKGFGAAIGRPGAPSLPEKVYWVAIPAGATPRLITVEASETDMPRIRPRPFPTEDLQTEGDEDGGGRAKRSRRFVEERAIYEGDALFPHAIVRLGDVGVFRDQRYVEVRISPVRYDPRTRGIRVASRVRFVVAFDGDDGRRTEAQRDPRFEDTYRRAFVNYAQGTTFRLEAEAPPVSALEAPAAPYAGPLYRIKIRQDGVVRLDFTRMNGTGFLAEPLATWKLMNRGVEVPLHVNDVNGNGVMEAGDWVQFYAQAMDDEPKTALHTSMADGKHLYVALDFTDENVYFLSVEPAPRLRMATRIGDPVVRTSPTDFPAVARLETNDSYRPLGGADPWYWDPFTGAGTTRTITVPLPGLASGTLPVQVALRVRGLGEDVTTFPDHRTAVTLKTSSDVTLATNPDNGTFDGRTVYTHTFGWTYPGSGPVMTNPAKVSLDVQVVVGAPGYSNATILDWVEVTYRRSFMASGDALEFTWPDGDAQFDLAGFAAGTLPVVYEITGRRPGSDVVDAVRVTGATAPSTGAVRFRMDNDPLLADGTPRRFVVAGTAGAAIPASADFTADVVSDLRSTATQADLVVIAHPSVLDNPAACSSASLTALLNLRAGQGISSKVACIQDVYDEFNDGLAGPDAIQKFLAWVHSAGGWASPKPAFVLLLGDGSYDYKAGMTNGNLVPTQIVFRDEFELGYYASDSLLAAIVGTDSMPELIVGRIPARTIAQANAAIDKIRNYDASTPPGTWTRHAVFVSDRGKREAGIIDHTESIGFETVNDVSEAWMKRPPHTDTKLRYYSDYCSNNNCNPNQMTMAIKSAVNAGAATMQYSGHSNFNVWSDDRILDQGDLRFDLDDLNNGLMAPWLAAHNCLTGGFHTLAASVMGQDWITKGNGGAVGVFSPSGLSIGSIGEDVGDVLFRDFYGPPKKRDTGGVVADALAYLCSNGYHTSCQNYVLLGDPTTRLELPTVQPPTDVVADGGHQHVDLSWTASATPGATYDVYRTNDLVGGSYTKVNATPISGVAYADNGLTNTVTYYYAVVARDATGFESRWSHLNSDCGAPGATDCLSATALNPNPPLVPSNVVVSDPEIGSTLIVSWSANLEPDLLNYTVWYDTRPWSPSTPYRNSRNAAKATTYTLGGLTNDVVYYVAVTATNTSSQTSAFSVEGQGVPHLIRGLRSPQFISDLRVNRSGADAVLTWGAVTSDIYGKATSIVRYEVYRGTTPGFVPGAANRIGMPTTTTFTDPGAMGSGTPYHYLVRAVDNTGNGGGLGEQLPNGIGFLSVSESITTPGWVVLSWPAVVSNFDGGPVHIASYQIYASSSPFRRSSIRDGLTPPGPPIATTTSTSFELNPGAGIQYYSVLVVDAKGNVSPF
jgi:hypothetical protein